MKLLQAKFKYNILYRFNDDGLARGVYYFAFKYNILYRFNLF